MSPSRLILSRGHEGTDAAGHVIEAFGNFVMSGNFVIGIIVFTILVIVNFVVITKGSGRIAEVAARFHLDAMPGKQMAIDADLSAGLIDEKEARRRRQTLEDAGRRRRLLRRHGRRLEICARRRSFGREYMLRFTDGIAKIGRLSSINRRKRVIFDPVMPQIHPYIETIVSSIRFAEHIGVGHE